MSGFSCCAASAPAAPTCCAPARSCCVLWRQADAWQQDTQGGQQQVPGRLCRCTVAAARSAQCLHDLGECAFIVARLACRLVDKGCGCAAAAGAGTGL